MVVIALIWILASILLVRLIIMNRKASAWVKLRSASRWRPDIATRVLMPLAVIGQAAITSWFVTRVGDISLLIAVVQIAVASAFWQLINDSSEESRFQPLGVIVPMLLLFGLIAALTIDIQSSFLPAVTWRSFIGK
jgi:NADH:ubiquinone oxidoreductase subunit 5 (subunit L)/multisubunit Na+/H+ antiporter MnhA subunit